MFRVFRALTVRGNEETLGFSLGVGTMRETTLDEVCDEIGYSGTRVIAVWYRGKSLYVPATPVADHPLATLIGLRPLRRLVVRYGGWVVNVPSSSIDEALVRDQRIAEMLGRDGLSVGAIASLVDLSVRRVEQIREELVLRGWIAYSEGRRPRRGQSRPMPEILGTGGIADEPPPPSDAGILGTGGVAG